MSESIAAQPILAIWSPDRSFKIVRTASITQGPTRCPGCGADVWPVERDYRTMVVSADGRVRLCLLCLLEVSEPGFFGSYIQMHQDGPDPLETVAWYFLLGYADGHIERAVLDPPIGISL
jgi:hypothetical protein